MIEVTKDTLDGIDKLLENGKDPITFEDALEENPLLLKEAAELHTRMGGGNFFSGFFYAYLAIKMQISNDSLEEMFTE